jgi:glutaconate CoA-transferase, subunit B
MCIQSGRRKAGESNWPTDVQDAVVLILQAFPFLGDQNRLAFNDNSKPLIELLFKYLKVDRSHGQLPAVRYRSVVLYTMTDRPAQNFAPEELLADAIMRLIGDVRHVAVGNASPIPALAALTLRERGGGKPYVSLLGSRRHMFFTDGGRELFDCAGQGRIDVFFLSGGEIDGAGNINLVSIGDYAQPDVRFPGSFGSGYLYYVVPKVILFRIEHSRRTLVPKVSFISAPGGNDENVHRTGGPIALITNRCLFAFDRARKRFRLESVHPGHTVEEVIENTGFDFDRPDAVPETPAPSAETLRLMRETVAPQLAEVYPQFAQRVFGVESPKSA